MAYESCPIFGSFMSVPRLLEYAVFSKAMSTGSTSAGATHCHVFGEVTESCMSKQHHCNDYVRYLLNTPLWVRRPSPMQMKIIKHQK